MGMGLELALCRLSEPVGGWIEPEREWGRGCSLAVMISLEGQRRFMQARVWVFGEPAQSL